MLWKCHSERLQHRPAVLYGGSVGSMLEHMLWILSSGSYVRGPWADPRSRAMHHEDHQPVSLGLKANAPLHLAILAHPHLYHDFLFYGHWKSLHATSSGSLTLLLSFCHPTAARQSVLEDSQCYVPVSTCSHQSYTICWLKCPSLWGGVFTSVPEPGKKFLTVIVRPKAGKGASMTLLMRGCTKAGEMPRLFSTSSKIWNEGMKTEKHVNQEAGGNTRNEMHQHLHSLLNPELTRSLESQGRS